MNSDLEWYRQEMHQELDNILSYWIRHTIDLTHGGFAGKIDNGNNIDAKAAKGSVLNSSILSSFSSAYNLTRQVRYLQMAERAFKYIKNYFIDTRFGGVYWTVDFNGKPLDTKKQIYAQASAISGLSEYFKAFEDEQAKKMAIDLYRVILEHGYDKINGGYIEARTREWKDVADTRLNPVDPYHQKSVNTHLQVLEGFTNLYSIWPNKELRQRIAELIRMFLDHIINHDTNHLNLFFNDAWNPEGQIQSYGHDIAAAWLLQKATESISDKSLVEEVKSHSINLADATATGLDKDGGLWYQYDHHKTQLVKEKHGWVQAEAMVGFFNAWQTTGKQSYFYTSLNSWKFIKNHILDKAKGEWFGGLAEDYSALQEKDKVGLWKSPYHNTRACIEIISRIAHLNI